MTVTRTSINDTRTAQDTLGVALVGAGAITRRHAAAIADRSGADLRWVVDLNTDAATRMLMDVGLDASVTDSLDDVLHDPQTQAVYICTPNFLHGPQALAAVESGKHVLVEKPVAIDPAQGKALARAAQTHDRLVLVGHQYRFLPAFRRARQWVRDGRIGEVCYVHDRISADYRIQQRARWFLDPKLCGGGVLMNNGIHQLDRICWLLDQLPVGLRSHVGYRFPGLAIDSDAWVELAFSDQTIAQIMVSGHPAEVTNRVHILGTTGEIVLGMRGEVALHRADDAIEEQHTLTDPLNGAGHFLDLFHRVVRGQPLGDGLPDAAWGTHLVELVREAMDQSPASAGSRLR